MNKRDLHKLDIILLKLTARFSDERINFDIIGRGDARAIVALIREHNKARRTRAVKEERT